MRKMTVLSMITLLSSVLVAAGASLASPDRPMQKTETMEPVVVSATLTEQKLSETPASVQVIDKAQIREMGADSVAQALQEALGLVLNTESGRTQRPSIRGTGSLHTVVLLDGRRLAPGYRGMSDINQIPVVMIERIEIVRGPSSALFGSDALGGVINIITRRPPKKDVEAGLDLKVGANTDDGGETFLPQAYAGAGLDPFRFILAGAYQNRNGWDFDGAAPDDGDDLDQRFGWGRAAVDLGPDHSLSFGGYYNRFGRDGQRDIQNQLTQRDATDETSEVFVRYDGTFSQDFDFMLQAYHAEYSTDIDLTPRVSDPYLLIKEKYIRTAYEGRFTARLKGLGSVILGGELRDDTRGSDNLSPEYDTENKAVFGQVDLMFFDRLNLLAGLRLDDHSEFGSEWSPRVALSFALNPNLRLKAAYGHGFRAPIPYELYVTSYQRRGRDTYRPNPDLQPETTRSFEVGLQSNWNLGRGLDVDLTYFHNDIDDMIGEVLLSSSGQGNSAKRTYRWENISQAETSGVEMLGSLRLPDGWKLGAGLTYLNTENQDTGEQLANQPGFKGNLNASWHLASLGLKARLSFTWYAGVEDGAGNSLDDFTTLDVWLGKDLPGGTQVYAGMKNILDNEVDDYEVQPAFVYLGVKWDY